MECLYRSLHMLHTISSNFKAFSKLHPSSLQVAIACSLKCPLQKQHHYGCYFKYNGKRESVLALLKKSKLNTQRWSAFKILKIKNLNKVAGIGEVSLTSAIVIYVPTSHWLTKRKVVRSFVPVVGNLNNKSNVCKQVSNPNHIFAIV